MNNKTIIRTLSLVGLLAISNISFAAAREMPYMMNSGVAAIENIKNIESAKGMHNKGGFSYLDPRPFLQASAALEEQKLDFNHMFGLFLEFGKGEICISKLQKEVSNKIKSVKSLKIKKDKLAKSYKETVLVVWEDREKELAKDKKELDENKVDIKKLREKYKEKAIWWFSSNYGLLDKKEGNCPDTALNTE